MMMDFAHIGARGWTGTAGQEQDLASRSMSEATTDRTASTWVTKKAIEKGDRWLDADWCDQRSLGER